MYLSRVYLSGIHLSSLASMRSPQVSQKSDTIFGQGTMPESSTSHIGQGVALVARTAAFVYIYARISQIAEMTLSFYATAGAYLPWEYLSQAYIHRRVSNRVCNSGTCML